MVMSQLAMWRNLMKTEIEAKWLEIDHDEFRRKLTKLGGRRVRSLMQMVRAVFYDAERKMTKIGARVRVRDEGDRITMTYKRTDDATLTGTKEVNLVVDDFGKAVDFLKQIGMVQKSVEETKRESWELDGAEIELDEWPWLPPFVEIEAESKPKLVATAKKLGLNMGDAMYGSADFVYEKYYDVTCDEVNAWPEIRFGDAPEWLEGKRRAK
jgi:adenylate cyclase class 2